MRSPRTPAGRWERRAAPRARSLERMQASTCDGIGASHGRGEIVAQRLGVRERRPARRGVAALHDRAIEIAGASRRDQVQADAVPARRLTGDRHIVRIAAEGRDVIADPRQRRALIEEPVVARRRIRRDPRRSARGWPRNPNGPRR